MNEEINGWVYCGRNKNNKAVICHRRKFEKGMFAFL